MGTVCQQTFSIPITSKAGIFAGVVWNNPVDNGPMISFNPFTGNDVTAVIDTTNGFTNNSNRNAMILTYTGPAINCNCHINATTNAAGVGNDARLTVNYNGGLLFSGGLNNISGSQQKDLPFTIPISVAAQIALIVEIDGSGNPGQLSAEFIFTQV